METKKRQKKEMHSSISFFFLFVINQNHFLSSILKPMHMEIQKREIYRAIAEISYVIAKADKGLSAEERIAFNKIIQDELELDSWVAQSRFELLDEITHPTIEKAYNEAIHDLRKYKKYLTPELKEKALRVFSKVAHACSGLSEREAFIIDRFKHDLAEI